MTDGIPQLPKRKADAHKGDFGRALLVGGSRGMTGAIALAGMSALRSGAGLVTLAVPDPCLETVAAIEPSYMTIALPADAHGRLRATAMETIASDATLRSAVAYGPGVSRSEELDALAAEIYSSLALPCVIDADGLNALAAQDALLSKPAGPRVLTPHPGELARLTGVSPADRSAQVAAATDLAKSCGVVVLKGHRTVITDGEQRFENHTGNPGMATGGSGDVLTGVITALLCQRMSPVYAARLGVHVHGRAGDLAAESLGEVSMTARDIVDFLPAAFRELTSQ
ncbi:MAG: NAD(P)H-hydrate dehydratase [Pirellulales bacterium]|nr:NAD(P)H-hydrate dehydratase [Pirellulales bacterium]